MESSQHTQCIYRDKLGKLTNYKTLPVNPNNTIQSNLEGSKPPLTVLSSKIKRNTLIIQHLFDQAKHERGSLHITESHAYLHFLTANMGRSTSLLQHKPAQSPQTNKIMQSYELPVHTHTVIVQMDHNQIKYSQHRLSLFQQRFNFSSTILLRLL